MPAFKFRLLLTLLSVGAAAALPAFAQACQSAPMPMLRPAVTEAQMDAYETVFIAERVSSRPAVNNSIKSVLGYDLVTFKIKKTIKGDNIPTIVSGWVSNGQLSICPRYDYIDGPFMTVLAQAPDEEGNIGIVTFAGLSDPKFSILEEGLNRAGAGIVNSQLKI